MKARGTDLAALLHAGSYVFLLSWVFGGNALWLRTPLLFWGSLCLPLLLLGLLGTPRKSEGGRLLLLTLVPLFLLNLQVALSTFNPNFRELRIEGLPALVPGGEIPWLPSSSRPLLSWQALWLFDTLFLTALNLALWVRHRRDLRLLLGFCALNLALLSIFGSLQKLSGAKGLFFDRFPSPNPEFFASFIYRNHWAAFALLGICCCLGLAWHHANRGSGSRRDFWHGPGFLFLSCAVLAAWTIPLSSSRSGSVLLFLLCLAACGHFLLNSRRNASDPENPAKARIATLLGALAFTAIALWTAAPVIKDRLADTREQAAAMLRQGDIGSRLVLYRDTATLALEKPLFGWGMGSYPTAFFQHNTQRPNRDRLPVFYADAHCDWLQSLAELGLLGSLCVASLAVLPLLLLRKIYRIPLLSRYLLLGCALILAYSLVEFPFGNPALAAFWWLCLYSSVRYARAE